MASSMRVSEPEASFEGHGSFKEPRQFVTKEPRARRQNAPINLHYVVIHKFPPDASSGKANSTFRMSVALEERRHAQAIGNSLAGQLAITSPSA